MYNVRSKIEMFLALSCKGLFYFNPKFDTIVICSIVNVFPHILEISADSMLQSNDALCWQAVCNTHRYQTDTASYSLFQTIVKNYSKT